VVEHRQSPKASSDPPSASLPEESGSDLIPPVSCSWGDVFGDPADAKALYITIEDWSAPVQVFVGRNGSGKTKAAQALFRELGGETNTQFLSSDRLFGLLTAGHYGANLMGPSGEFKGLALSAEGRQAAETLSNQYGLAPKALFALHDNPVARIRTTAAIQEATGRTVDLSTPNAGLIDPIINFDTLSYSLFRSEGHGLREMVVLFAAIYSQDWSFLIVDEPELNLHPSMTRLWMNELRDECKSSGRRAIVITHEPRLIDPQSCDDLKGVWLFRPMRQPVSVITAIKSSQAAKVDEDLWRNPQLVSDLLFSPHPVLIEGDRDLAAFQSAARRLGTHSSVSQTDFIECGGSDGVARWLEIVHELGLEAFAVADLDAIFSSKFTRTADKVPSIKASYMDQWQAKRSSDVLRPLYDAMKGAQIPSDPASRRDWLASVLASNDGAQDTVRIRSQKLLEFWRDAGIWIHPEGDLERALGMSDKVDAREYARAAAHQTLFDNVVRWALFHFDQANGVPALLEGEVERIAQEIQRFVRRNPGRECTSPVGMFADADARLVTVEPLGDGRHALIVKEPAEFRGCRLEFDRSTSPDEMRIQPPE
jgi:DNA polymerase III delta prime subunit